MISLSPKTTLKDIYQSILRKSNVLLKTSYTEGSGDKTKFGGKASIQSAVAMIAKASAEATAEREQSSNFIEQYDEIEFRTTR